jgi:serralysin
MSGIGNDVKSIKHTGNELIDGVIYGTAWQGKLTYYFPSLESQYNYKGEAQNNFSPATQQQANSALFALEKSYGTSANDGFSVEGFTNASISSGSADSATMRFAQSDTPTTAYAYMPGEYKQAGDMWFGRNYDYTDAQPGNYAWHSVLHEIGHALGLKHGNEAENGFAALPEKYDSLEYSVMTYRSYEGSDVARYTYSEWSAPQTYMMADIAALQKIYGADYTTNSGNTVYSWDPDSGDTRVNGKLAIDAGDTVIFATIWDGGGTDTYDLSLYASDMTINLGVGKHSAFDASQLASLGDGHYAGGNIYNALTYHGDTRSLIENVIGGTGADRIAGNVVNNMLQGGAGDDVLLGGGGNDRLIGGDGADALKGGAGRDALWGGAGDDIMTGGQMADVFNFKVSEGSDTIADFTHGTDHIRIDVDYQQVLAHAADVDGNLVITFDDASSLTLLHVSKADLSASDFLL